MKFSMIFDAVDRASRTMRSIMDTEKKMAAVSKVSSDKSARAAAETERKLSKTERTLNLLKRSGRSAFNVVTSSAEKATRAVKALHRKSKELAGFGMGQISSGFSRAQGGLLAGAAAVSIAYGGAAIAASSLVGTASDFERFQTILETTEGSAVAAEKAMGWVQNFAVTTPYELDQVTDAFVSLRAYGLDPTQGLLQTLGDTSAAMGKPLQQAVEAIADAVTGENERLKEFGIKASKTGELITYEYTNAAGKTVQATVEAGDRLAIQQKLMTIMNEKYSGSMSRLSQTWDGMVSNVSDQWTKFQVMIMDAGLFDWMKGKLEGILATINQMEADGSLKEWAETISTKIQSALESMWEFGKGVYEIISKVSEYLATAADYVGGWENLSMILAGIAFAPTLISTAAGLVQIATGLGALTGALMANPISLAIGAIAGGVYLIYENWDKIGPYFQKLWDGVKAIFSSVVFPTIDMSTVSSAMTSLSGIVETGWKVIEVILDKIVAGATALGETVGSAIETTVSGAQAALDAITGSKGVDRIFDQLSDLAERGYREDFVQGQALTEALSAGEISLEAYRTTLAAVIEGGGDFAQTARQMVEASKLLDDFQMPEPKVPDLPPVSDMEATIGKLQSIEKAAGAVPGMVEGALAKIDSYLARTDFTDRGIALMRTLAQGIRAGTHHIVDATRDATQKVRDHLPSSPAKTGPLSDIHRLKFGETIAASIRSDAMVAAMRNAAEATLAVMAPFPDRLAMATQAVPVSATHSALPSARDARSANVPASIAGRGGIGSRSGETTLSISYGDIHIQGGSEENKRKFAEELRSHRREIKRLVEDEDRRKQRKDF